MPQIQYRNRCFPTKAIRGWLATDDDDHCTIVAVYFAEVAEFGEPVVQLRTSLSVGDPLFAVWAHRRGAA